jgi:hypothetical protein
VKGGAKMGYCNICGDPVVKEGPIVSTLGLTKSGLYGLAEFLNNHLVKTIGSGDLGGYPTFEIETDSLAAIERVLSLLLRHGLEIKSRASLHGKVVTSFRIYFLQTATQPEASTVSPGNRIPFS